MKLKHVISFIFILSLVIFSGCVEGVNGSVHIGSGENLDHGRSTVNGNVYVGDNSIVKGKCSTVNGKIEVGSNCEVGSLTTVNRGVTVGENTKVDGRVSTVNGSISCEKGVQVSGNVSLINGSITCKKGVEVDGYLKNINGAIHLTGTVVKEDVSTHNGDITLENKSIIKGDIVIKRSNSTSFRERKLTIRISGDSLVEGGIINKDSKLEVKVIIAKGGKVHGKVEDAEVIYQ